MAAPKRSKVQIARDRLEIARRYLQGQFQHEIAAALGMTQRMVSYDLRIVQKIWQQSMSTSQLNELRTKELAKIDNLERSYWQAWERSQQPREVTIKGQSRDLVKVEKRCENRDGNPKFLAGVQWCIERRCNILGLDGSLKADVTGQIENNTDFDPSTMSTEELMRILSSGNDSN